MHSDLGEAQLLVYYSFIDSGNKINKVLIAFSCTDLLTLPDKIFHFIEKLLLVLLLLVAIHTLNTLHWKLSLIEQCSFRAVVQNQINIV
jgi:hypothetical protein